MAELIFFGSSWSFSSGSFWDCCRVRLSLVLRMTGDRSGGIVCVPTAKYPRWWFDWNLELTRVSTRVAAYLALVRDAALATNERFSP
jgi:hypothetical protein